MELCIHNLNTLGNGIIGLTDSEDIWQLTK